MAFAICSIVIMGPGTCVEESDVTLHETIIRSAAHYCLSKDEIKKLFEFPEEGRFILLRGLNSTASKIWILLV